MRAKPISVRFPIPKIAAAKLRDLAISRDPRLLELGILAVQITEHEKIVVSFGKPPKAKPKSRMRENPKKTRVKLKAARGRPKAVSPGMWPVSGTSIAFPGVTNSWQDRNPLRHLNNKKVIIDKSNTKVQRQAAKDQFHQTVYQRQNCQSALSKKKRNSSVTAVTGNARNTAFNGSDSSVSSNLPLKWAAEHHTLDNKSHNALENGETKRSRAEIGTNEGAPFATPSPCPSDTSSLSLSSASPLPLLGEEPDRSRSSSTSSQNEQGYFSLTGIQEKCYMGRQRALFDWFMNTNEKKFSASNRLRELAKGHGGEGVKDMSCPESSQSGQIATISTIASLPNGTNMLPKTSTSCVTTSTSLPRPATCKSMGMNKTIPAPSPGIHRVKMSNRSLSGPTSMSHFSVKEGLSGKQTDQVIRISPQKNSINKKSVSGALEANSDKDTRTSNSENHWSAAVASYQQNSFFALKGIVNSVASTEEISNIKTEINSKNDTLGLNCLTNEISTIKEKHEAQIYPKIVTSKTELGFNIFGQPNSASVAGDTNINTENINSNVNSVSNEETQVLTMPTIDANNNQTVPKSPLMYPYSTGMLSNPFTVDSKATARQGVVLGLQYATVKPQISAFHQAHIPSQLTMQMDEKPKLSRNVETTVSCDVKPEASKDCFIPLVEPHFVQSNPEARTLPQPISVQHCQVAANAAANTLQTTVHPWTVTNICHSQSEPQSYSTNMIASVPAFVATPQILINPQPVSNLQVFPNSQVNPQNTEKIQNEIQQTATTTAVTVAPKISSTSESDKSCPSHKSMVTQDSVLFTAAKENIQQQSGEHLDDILRKVKTEDYTQSQPDSDKASCSEVNKSDESQSITAAPIQFIDLSGTLRYWQQWSLYYRSLIERQNAVAALLSMQNAVPSATAVKTVGDLPSNVNCAPEAAVRTTSSLTCSGEKEKKAVKQSLNDDTSEKHIETQSEKDTDLLSGVVLKTMKDQQFSKMQPAMCDRFQQLVANSNSEDRTEKAFAIDEIPSEDAAKDLSTEATVSSSRKSVIVDTRTNELDFKVSEKPEVISKRDDGLRHAILGSCKIPESNSTKMENSTRSINDKYENGSSNDIPGIEDSQNTSTSQKNIEMRKAVCQLDRIKGNFIFQEMEILQTEQVLDLNLAENGRVSPLMQDSEDSSELIPMGRRLRNRRSSSNPLLPELSFIPESSIECVNVGGNKRGM